MSHKWGTSTKVGDAFPNVAVDIGFVGLDPNNRKMSGDLNKGQKTLWVSLPGAFTPT
jgi:peroxiredoxin